jgi:uncharacterized protein YecE (DUF72 family)
MDFGKVSILDLAKVDFSMPPTPEFTEQVLSQTSQGAEFNVYVGCPIWANKNWVGNIYPPKAKEKDFLKYYAQQFNTIELNVTHYNIPTSATIDRWRRLSAEGFRFAPKFPQEISHQLLPEGRAYTMTRAFCEVIKGLGNTLGRSFLQLSPYFSPNQEDKLWQFLDEFAHQIPLSIEFRHPDWFLGGKFEQIAQKLENYKIGTVITDVSGRRDVLHLCLSLPSLMLRFVGNDLHPTDYTRVKAWVERICEWKDLGLEEVYFFAHEPDNDSSPELAKFFIQEMNKICQLNLALPTSYDVPKQGSLF